MANLEDGIVQPVCTDGTPRLGPFAIMVATDADVQALRRNLNMPDSRDLYLSRLHYNASQPELPALVGPLMGAPYAVMILETLRAWGVRTILFSGWCGAISKDASIGDILLPDSAVIDEGTSPHYKQLPGVVVHPRKELHQLLCKSLQDEAVSYTVGRIWSTDGIFRETPSKVRKFQELGCLAVEMEISALFSAARFYKLSLAAILIVSDELASMQWKPGFKNKEFKEARQKVCHLVTDVLSKHVSSGQ